MRQVRYGNHETRPGQQQHAHFETYGESYYSGGQITETTTVHLE